MRFPDLFDEDYYNCEWNINKYSATHKILGNKYGKFYPFYELKRRD